jgi:glycosyltransferase involved in cell wall biosynthesis
MNNEGKIKVLHILRATTGVDVSLRMIISHTDDNKFEHIVIHEKDDNIPPYYTKSGKKVKVYRLPIVRELAPAKDLKSIFKTKKIIKKEKINLIHTHSAKGGFIGRIAALGTGITVLHTPQAFSYLSTPDPLKRFVYLTAERILKHFHSKLVASSESELRRGIEEVGFKKENTYLFNNCIDPIDTDDNLEMEKSWPGNYLCTVGRPSYQKHLDMMVRVMYELKKEIPGIHLVLVGVGYHFHKDLELLKKLIDRLDLKNNITLLEWMPREKVFKIVKDAQVYLTTSLYEGMPYAVLEAMALGKPVVATDVDGNRDLIRHGYNGFLVPVDDVEAMKNHILKLLRNNNLMQEFSANAKKLFFDKFNAQKNFPLLEKIYSDNAKQVN